MCYELADLVITRLKGVKHGPVARQMGVAWSRPWKKAQLSDFVLATTKRGFLGLGKAEPRDGI